MLLIAHRFAKCKIRSLKDAARASLHLSTFVSCVDETRWFAIRLFSVFRYLPEVVAILRGLLFSAIESEREERTVTLAIPLSLEKRRILLVKADEVCSYRECSV